MNFYNGFLGRKNRDLERQVQNCDDAVVRDLYVQIARMTDYNREGESIIRTYFSSKDDEEKEEFLGMFYYNCLEPIKQEYSDITQTYDYYTNDAPIDDPSVHNTLMVIKDEADYLYNALTSAYEKYLERSKDGLE